MVYTRNADIIYIMNKYFSFYHNRITLVFVQKKNICFDLDMHLVT